MVLEKLKRSQLLFEGGQEISTPLCFKPNPVTFSPAREKNVFV